ncbi:hypothetical protein [Epilithonimonas mollis]|uniref:hypothetical protein n=1 Tax=Epilithonimonas mollis TaxID=216903 RepID=UPI0015874151|nr:hypothetical protein [Epilithonimonas mollis]
MCQNFVTWDVVIDAVNAQCSSLTSAPNEVKISDSACFQRFFRINQNAIHIKNYSFYAICI